MDSTHFNVLWTWSYRAPNGNLHFCRDYNAIFSKAQEQHINYVPKFLFLQYNVGAILQLQKCNFTNTVNYLSHSISSWRLKFASHTKDTIRVPSFWIITKPRIFSSLSNVFWHFALNLAQNASPLNNLFMKTQPNTFALFDSKKIQSTDIRKNPLISPPVLPPSTFGRHMTHDTFPCNVQIGCVLPKNQPDYNTKRIEIWSTLLSNTEPVYNTTQRKCQDFVRTDLLLKPSLEGQHLTIRTNLDAFKLIHSLADITGWLTRWRLRFRNLTLTSSTVPE